MKIQEETVKMEVSPYLSAIQSLKGKTASEKYKELHLIAAEILKNDKEKVEFLQTRVTDRVPAVLCPTLHILLGMRLKSNEAVISALKSSDSSIAKQGLKAKWFFKATNSFIDINYLMQELLPFISLQTRLELIKKLGKCLKVVPEKANIFFKEFVDLYGIDETLPLLFACGEDFIYQEILRLKINLSRKMLEFLYNRYSSQLVIRYLQLGNENNKSNLEDRLVHRICLATYSSLFSALMKNHMQEFIEFYSYFPETFMDYQKKIGITGTKFFLKNSVDTLIQKPRIFLPILSQKIVAEKLSDEQFTAMFKNLLPEKLLFHQFPSLVHYLKYCPKDKAYKIFSKSYQMTYGSELLDYKDILGNAYVIDILPLDKKIELVKEYLKNRSKNETFMQVKDSLPLLKEKIDKADDDMKAYYLSYMIYSCRLYEDKEGLLEVLKYFYNHLKNESAYVFQSLLERLYVQSDISLLNKEHWKILGELIQRGYITGNLFVKVKNELDSTVDKDHIRIIQSALEYFLKQCQTNDADENDRQYLGTIVNVFLEFFCEHNFKKQFIPKSMEIQKDCLQKFLSAVPLKYPENHAVWRNLDNKIRLSSYLISSMIHYNKNTPENNKLTIQDYPWLKQFATDLLKAKNNIPTELTRSYARFKQSLRSHDLDFYQSIIDGDPNLINEVATNDALIILKTNAKKVLDKWSLYLTACKESLLKGSKAARSFVASLKWHQEIPVKFVEQCLQNLDDEGNLLVLAKLLEGDAFGQIIKPFLPKKMEVDCDVEDAKKSYRIMSVLPRAFKFTNPPVSLDILAPLCQDKFSLLAMKALTNLAPKIPVDCVTAFADKLMTESESKENFGIHLLFQVAEKPKVSKLMSKIVKDGKCLKNKKVMAEMIFHLFTQTPCEETWHLMKDFIQLLNVDDESIFSILLNINNIINSRYISNYAMDLSMKINEFTEVTKHKKTKLIKSLVEELEICADILSEDLLSFVIKEYFFDLSYNFLFEKYLLYDPEKFETRLELIVDILTGTLTQSNQSSPKKFRLCPVNQHIHKFLSNQKLFDHLTKKFKSIFKFNFPTHDYEEMKLRFIKRMLGIPSIHEDLSIYVDLNVYKIYFEESDPKKFGEKCGKNVKELAETLDKEYVIKHYGDTMCDLVHKNCRKPKKFTDKELDVIDGLKSCDLNVSISIGLKLLDSISVKNYDQRYDEFIDLVRKNSDLPSRMALDKFLASVYDFANACD